ncbi:Uncharacterised protein [Klebsiella pneumoniae]|uniref:Uncharacterized protein n=1 Tax=Klebsiella pneumoniae TaxID=573 RepID=A0A378H427_KLEPN|nr:Uncharacterised protein [Klebsiella pneumoniae]
MGISVTQLDWGVGATGIASIDPRSHQLSDARNNFTSRTWVNLFRKWTAELSCHAKNEVDTQATGLSTYYNAVNVEVQDAWKDFTPADISSGLLTQTKGRRRCVHLGPITPSDILAGRAVSFQFSGLPSAWCTRHFRT